MTEQQSNEERQKKIESIAKREDMNDIEKMSLIKIEFRNAGKPVNNEQIANTVFCSKRSLLNTLMTDRGEAVKSFTQNGRQTKPSGRKIVGAGEGAKGVVLTLLDSNAPEQGVIPTGFNFLEYELYLKETIIRSSEDLRLHDLSDDILNRMLNCIVERFSKFENELLAYNIWGQRKALTTKHGYMQNMLSADSIRPPANLSYITHTSNDKGYKLDLTALEKLQELRKNRGEFYTDTKNIFTAIDKALEYTAIKPISINARPEQWQAICLVPDPLYQKI